MSCVASPTAAANEILRELTTLQYLHPHWPLDQVIQGVCGHQDCPALAGKEALQSLNLQGQVLVGRLSRQQITELGLALESARQADSLTSSSAVPARFDPQAAGQAA
jgi:hypothetical protein